MKAVRNRPTESKDDIVECPLCKEDIKSRAIRCKHCHADLVKLNERRDPDEDFEDDPAEAEARERVLGRMAETRIVNRVVDTLRDKWTDMCRGIYARSQARSTSGGGHCGGSGGHCS